MLKVMFLCTGNSCRSQMAEGFSRVIGKDVIEPYSAGLVPASVVNPRAVQAMKESGIDISHQRPKEIEPELLNKMDVVVTLCDNAGESCPWTPPAIKRFHWFLKDPAGVVGTEEEIMAEFRRVRDEIKERIIRFIGDTK